MVNRSFTLLAGDYVCFAATITCLLFLISYPLLAKNWWKYGEGRAIWFIVFVLFSVLLLVDVALVYGVDWPTRDWVRVLVFASVGWAVAYLTAVLLLAQRLKK